MRTYVHHTPTLRLTLERGEKITTTAAHPFYVAGQGFVKAGKLAIGNAIVTRAGPALKVVGIRNTGKTQTVYDFEVQDFHTYFVGKANGGMWVHNVCGTPTEADPFGVTNEKGVYVPKINPEPGASRGFDGPCVVEASKIQNALVDSGQGLGQRISVTPPGEVLLSPDGKPWEYPEAVKVGDTVLDPVGTGSSTGMPYGPWTDLWPRGSKITDISETGL